MRPFTPTLRSDASHGTGREAGATGHRSLAQPTAAHRSDPGDAKPAQGRTRVQA